MPFTTKDKNGNDIYITDPDGNELQRNEKTVAGILLALLTLFAVVLIIAHWPDKMPPPGQDVKTKYIYKWFCVRYAGIDGVGTEYETIYDPKKADSIKAAKDAASGASATEQRPEETGSDTADKKNDTAGAEEVDPTAKEEDTLTNKAGSKNDSTKKDQPVKTDSASTPQKQLAGCEQKCPCVIDLNTLILLLVAFGGFLGNIIHVASSFTTFIGDGKFKRSWILWYFVKPFTASTLAVGVYIIFRAGFLNSAEATASVNLYGVVGIAVLAGLYTDMATLKLKEVFGVIFNTTTVRADGLEAAVIKITGSHPQELPLNVEASIVLSGTGFTNRIIKVEIDQQEIKELVKQPNSIAFKYTGTKAKHELIIYDKDGKQLLKYDLITAIKMDIAPTYLQQGASTEITISGAERFVDITKELSIKIADTVIDASTISKKVDQLTFNYIAPAEPGDIDAVITDENGKELLKKKLTVVALDISPLQIEVNSKTTVTVTGAERVADITKDLKITIGDTGINATALAKTGDTVTFDYTAPGNPGEIDAIITDESGKELLNKKITIAGTQPPQPPPGDSGAASPAGTPPPVAPDGTLPPLDITPDELQKGNTVLMTVTGAERFADITKDLKIKIKDKDIDATTITKAGGQLTFNYEAPAEPGEIDAVITDVNGATLLNKKLKVLE